MSVTRNWSKFYIGGEKSIPQNIENEIDKIISDNSITLVTKLERAEKLLKKTETDAFERLSNAHNERDEKKAKLNKLKQNRSRWNSTFVWYQIIGLILFTGSETLEKIINPDSKANSKL